MLRVLIVEDAPQYRQRLQELLCGSLSGYEVVAVGSRDEALTALALQRPDLVILDLAIPLGPGGETAEVAHGEAVLKAVKETGPYVGVIIISGHGDLVREYLKEKGADDFFTKDQPQAWEQEKLHSQIERLIGHVVCRSAAMQQVRAGLAALPEAMAVCTLSGPLGSGKEYLCSVVHRCSRRALRGFQSLSLHTLISGRGIAELIGARGERPQRGLLEDEPGCVYLHGFEHAGQLSPTEQECLADVLQGATDGRLRYRPLESPQWETADTLLVVGTTAPLEHLGAEGQLVPRLHGALKAAPILTLPPPEGRIEDVAELLNCWRRVAAQGQRKSVRRLGPGVVEAVELIVSTGDLPDGWDAIRRMVESGVRQSADETLSVADLLAGSPETLPALPERYSLTRVRGGVVEQRRATELDLAIALSEAWPLVMRARCDEPLPVVYELVTSGETRPVGDERLGRLLHLLAARPGNVVELARAKRDLGMAPAAQIKRFILKCRELLDDTDVQDRRSRFIASHYSEAYSFSTETDFLVVCELPATD